MSLMSKEEDRNKKFKCKFVANILLKKKTKKQARTVIE